MRIRGHDQEMVNRAREIMDFRIVRIALTGEEVPWIVGPSGTTISRIRTDSGAVNIEINQVRFALSCAPGVLASSSLCALVGVGAMLRSDVALSACLCCCR